MQDELAYDSFFDLVRGRRSIRRFLDRPVPRSEIERILEAARWAPSAGNRQPFRFFVVASPERIASLAGEVRSAAEGIVRSVRDDLAADYASYVGNFHAFASAPVLIIAAFRRGPDLLGAAVTGRADRSTGRAPALDEISGSAAAIMIVTLAAHAAGLGTCWMTGPLIATEALRSLVGVPAGWEPAAVIALGHAAEIPAAPPRRPLSKLVRFVDADPSREGP